jgi:hypothetical protein
MSHRQENLVVEIEEDFAQTSRAVFGVDNRECNGTVATLLCDGELVVANLSLVRERNGDANPFPIFRYVR